MRYKLPLYWPGYQYITSFPSTGQDISTLQAFLLLARAPVSYNLSLYCQDTSTLQAFPLLARIPVHYKLPFYWPGYQYVTNIPSTDQDTCKLLMIAHLFSILVLHNLQCCHCHWSSDGRGQDLQIEDNGTLSGPTSRSRGQCHNYQNLQVEVEDSDTLAGPTDRGLRHIIRTYK